MAACAAVSKSTNRSLSFSRSISPWEGAHVDSQVALLAAVGLVYEHDDVAMVVQILGDAVELVDEGDDEPLVVGGQQVPQVALALGPHHRREAEGLQVLHHLRFQFPTVHDDQQGGVLQRGETAQLVSGDDHGQRLAGTLRVPYQTGVGLARLHAPHDAFGGSNLMGTQDELVDLVVGAEEQDFQVRTRKIVMWFDSTKSPV